ALQSRAAAAIVGEYADGKNHPKPLLISRQPRLAFARAALLLFPGPKHSAEIRPSAVVSASVCLGKNVTIEERVVINEGAEIGDNTRIGAGSVIGAGVRIGSDCTVYPNVTIYPGSRLGNRVIVHAGAVLGSDGFGYVRDRSTGHYEKFPQVGRLEIED